MCVNPFFKVIDGKAYALPCGKCLDCVKQWQNNWVFRMSKEAENSKSAFFITLTYNNENLPSSGEINKPEFQKFVKRLRKRYSPTRLRFFGCGEYGSKKGRPHYHLILFFDDLEEIKNVHTKVLQSWQKGFVLVSPINDLAQFRYVAKYINKLSGMKKEHKQKPFRFNEQRTRQKLSKARGNRLDKNESAFNCPQLWAYILLA